MLSVGEPYEMIVVDDASEDTTVAIARELRARVIRVEHRHISATRNSGAHEAHGDILFFVDADTLVNVAMVQSALREMRNGAVGGGCVPRFEGWLPLWWKLVYPFLVMAVRILRLPGGACQFCTRAAFAAMGGYSEKHYAAEDAVFSSVLKKQGRMVVPAEPVITSGRNLRAHSFFTIVRLLARANFIGPNSFHDRHGLDVWYRPKREINTGK
jgi:cellulose synthase/poly-beta-1,6-N-acetylglucosamine synthase-like glycosyltransferase